MGRIIFVTVCYILCLASMAWASAFCDGWEDGYIAGYCDRQYPCVTPLVPLCPLPRPGEETYLDGYNRGSLDGLMQGFKNKKEQTILRSGKDKR